MRNEQCRAIGLGLAVHVARFAIMMIALTAAPVFGISGWYLGLAANVACVIFAAILVTIRGLWASSGILVAWRSPAACLLLVPLAAEALLWAVPGGLVEQPPGYGLWTVTLVLAALNEELTSRVVVLERMRPAFGPWAAVTITAALFGLQHLSALATTSRTLDDILLNVLVSACYGFALASFQYRFRWVWPLVILHAGANFTTIFSAQPLADGVIAVTLIGFLVLGLAILRSPPNDRSPFAALVSSRSTGAY